MRALLFDFDGTIVDTEWPELASWQAVYAEHGLEVPMDRWLVTVGLPSGASGWHPADHLQASVPELDRDSVVARQRSDYLARVGAEPVLPGIVAWIEHAEAAGIAVGVASSATRDWVVPHLEDRGLLHRFRTVRTRDDVPRAKPAPDLYLLACADLGVDPNDAVAVEDSEHGVAAALAAGLTCIAVPNRLTRHHDLSGAHHRCERLADLDPAEFIAALRRH